MLFGLIFGLLYGYASAVNVAKSPDFTRLSELRRRVGQ